LVAFNHPENRRTISVHSKFWKWFSVDFLGIFKEMRWSYLPPLMVYLAAGVSGFTGIIETFFIKDRLGLSAAFLTGLAFWAELPWALKMDPDDIWFRCPDDCHYRHHGRLAHGPGSHGADAGLDRPRSAG
jgi:hypothetical protein